MPRGCITPRQSLGCIDEIRRTERHGHRTCSASGEFIKTSRQTATGGIGHRRVIGDQPNIALVVGRDGSEGIKRRRERGTGWSLRPCAREGPAANFSVTRRGGCLRGKHHVVSSDREGPTIGSGSCQNRVGCCARARLRGGDTLRNISEGFHAKSTSEVTHIHGVIRRIVEHAPVIQGVVAIEIIAQSERGRAARSGGGKHPDVVVISHDERGSASNSGPLY